MQQHSASFQKFGRSLSIRPLPHGRGSVTEPRASASGHLFSLRPLIPAAILLSIASAASPTAETILDRYTEVTGGRARYEKLTTQVSAGMIDIPAQGLSGTMAIYRAAPNQLYTVTELGPIGKIEEGVDGGIAWQNTPMAGPRVKQGIEKTRALSAAFFRAELDWRNQFDKVELAGSEMIGGKDCYQIVLSGKDAGSQTRYFDKLSGLLVKLNMMISSQVGEMNVETLFEDYREEGGIRSAHKWVQSVAGQKIVITIKKVEYNTEFPANRFDPPAEVKALLAKKK